jgi:hypothetical protein
VVDAGKATCISTGPSYEDSCRRRCGVGNAASNKTELIQCGHTFELTLFLLNWTKATDI